MKTSCLKEDKGFTLLELIIVLMMLAIVSGFLVRPLFRKEHNKNVRIANEINIMAAYTAAEREFTSGSYATDYVTYNNGVARYFNYYRYNTSTDTLDRLDSIELENATPLGVEAAATAAANKVCDFVMVSAGYGEDGKLEILTAPYYDASGNVVIKDGRPYGKNAFLASDK